MVLPANFSVFAKMQTGCSIYYAVIATQGNFHHIAGNNCAIFHNRHLADSTNCQNTGIRWIDDGSEFINTKHAEVGNRKCISFPI